MLLTTVISKNRPPSVPEGGPREPRDLRQCEDDASRKANRGACKKLASSYALTSQAIAAAPERRTGAMLLPCSDLETYETWALLPMCAEGRIDSPTYSKTCWNGQHC